MKRAQLSFWDFLVAGVLLAFGLSQGGAAILFAVFAFLLYVLVRILRHVHVTNKALDLIVSEDSESFSEATSRCQDERTKRTGRVSPLQDTLLR